MYNFYRRFFTIVSLITSSFLFGMYDPSKDLKWGLSFSFDTVPYRMQSCPAMGASAHALDESSKNYVSAASIEAEIRNFGQQISVRTSDCSMPMRSFSIEELCDDPEYCLMTVGNIKHNDEYLVSDQIEQLEEHDSLWKYLQAKNGEQVPSDFRFISQLSNGQDFHLHSSSPVLERPKSPSAEIPLLELPESIFRETADNQVNNIQGPTLQSSCIADESSSISSSEIITMGQAAEHHLPTQLNDRQYVCMHCQKIFSTLAGRNHHLHVHLGVCYFLCPHCKVPFNTARSVANHTKEQHSSMQCHDSVKNIQAVSRTLSNKRKHIKNDVPVLSQQKKEQKKSVCQHCQKSFSKPSILARHILVHSAERPFKCSECNMAFSDKTNMQRHEKTHNNVKDFFCKLCDKNFTRKEHVAAHLKGRRHAIPKSLISGYIGFAESITKKRKATW